VKDPDTGKRVARINPAEAWITTDVPQLRIVDDALWVLTTSRRCTSNLEHAPSQVEQEKKVVSFHTPSRRAIA
jgi:hypothetical protein